jgi:hypothetical protein
MLHKLRYCHKNKEDEMDGACSTNKSHGIHMQNLVGKPEEKRPLGRPRLGWEDSIIP